VESTAYRRTRQVGGREVSQVRFVRLTIHQSLPVRSCVIDGEAIVVNVSF
jgi:ATP-dependent DNA ligase